jgi:hypothetical protein
MVSSLQQYKHSLVWFISGLVMAFLISIGTSYKQPVTTSSRNYAPTSTQPVLVSEFAATHQEPNFYQ